MIEWNKNIKLVQDKTLKYLYFMDKSHPLADKKGRVYYHRHLASLLVGRWLCSDEHVHHKDGDRTNNTPSNLEVTSPSAHAKIHHPSTKQKEGTCIACGVLFKDGQKFFCSNPCRGIWNEKIVLSAFELAILVQIYTLAEIGMAYGVSASAIKKRCKKALIPIPNQHKMSRMRLVGREVRHPPSKRD